MFYLYKVVNTSVGSSEVPINSFSTLAGAKNCSYLKSHQNGIYRIYKSVYAFTDKSMVCEWNGSQWSRKGV